MTINVVTANNFKSTKQSRAKLLELLTTSEKRMFNQFVKSLQS